MLSKLEANVQQKRMKLAWDREATKKPDFEERKKEGRMRVAMRHTQTHTYTTNHPPTITSERSSAWAKIEIDQRKI